MLFFICLGIISPFSPVALSIPPVYSNQNLRNITTLTSFIPLCFPRKSPPRCESATLGENKTAHCPRRCWGDG